MIYSIDRRPKPPSLPIFNTQLPKFPSFYNLQPISIDSSNSSSILICKFFFLISSSSFLSTYTNLCFNLFLFLLRHVCNRSIIDHQHHHTIYPMFFDYIFPISSINDQPGFPFIFNLSTLQYIKKKKPRSIQFQINYSI
jgi:hypothetical protein